MQYTPKTHNIPATTHDKCCRQLWQTKSNNKSPVIVSEKSVFFKKGLYMKILGSTSFHF